MNSLLCECLRGKRLALYLLTPTLLLLETSDIYEAKLASSDYGIVLNHSCFKEMKQNVAATTPDQKSPSSAEIAFSCLERVVEELTAFQETIGGRDPKLLLQVDWDSMVSIDGCLEAFDALARRSRDPDALASLEESASALEECMGALEDLDFGIEIEQDDPGEPVLLSELMVGLQKTLNSLRDFID